MHRTLLNFAVSAVLLTGAARAQDTDLPSSAIAQPSSPAPAVMTTTPGQPAAPAGQVAAPPRITQIVYTPKLPTAQELTDAAAAQGFTIERITQTSLQVIAFYRNTAGQPVTVAYQTLPPAAVAQTPASPPVVVTSPPTVVYETAPRVIYYEEPAYYYPRYYYPPVSLSFGFGFRGGHHYRHR